MKEAQNTKEHGGDVSPDGGIDNNVSNETSEIPHVRVKLRQGDQPHAGIAMIKPSIIGTSSRPKPTMKLEGNLEISERMQQKTFGGPDIEDLQITAHELRRVDDTNRLRGRVCASTID